MGMFDETQEARCMMLEDENERLVKERDALKKEVEELKKELVRAGRVIEYYDKSLQIFTTAVNDASKEILSLNDDYKDVMG